MYLPSGFREDRREVQQELIRRHPLSVLVSDGLGGLIANSIPFQVYTPESEKGALQAHFARANTQVGGTGGRECPIIFRGLQDYISPSWMPS
jgi:transcriptional regulator